MQPPPSPANEDARLAELQSYGLLDTGPEQDFDDISYLTCSIAGTPIGIVSLVDENRQWFKSCVGVDAQETPRAISFCGHTILQRQPLIIEDARADVRFHDNPLVLGAPHIRFYAGFPLVSANGMNLGSLCAVDRRPRQLDESQIEALQRLARQTVKLMELRRESRLLEASQQHHRQSSQPPSPLQPAGHGSQPMLRPADELIRSLELMVSGESQPGFAVLRLSLKDLRRLQNSLGETPAQQLRQHLQERLLQLLPAEAVGAWFGSNELVVVLPYVSSETPLAVLAGTLCLELEEPVAIAGRLLSCQVAIGIALYKGNYTSAEALLADAAIAERIARSQAGSHFHFIDLATRIQAQEEIRLESGLRQALRHGELEPHFQPLVHLSTGNVMGVEALVRWRNEQGELVLPATLLPAAERAGLTTALDLQLIGKALDASTTIAAARPQQPLLLSLNLSAALLDSPLARQQLVALIDSRPLPPGWTLQVEMLEEALQESSTELEPFLQELRELGVLVAIDDFGTGYSSLSRLQSYPFHALKIDASFVKRIDNAQQPSNRLLELMRLLGHDLGLSVTAEGIETEMQRQWLTERGFDWGQGYRFARPMPLEALLSYLTAHDRPQSPTGG